MNVPERVERALEVAELYSLKKRGAGTVFRRVPPYFHHCLLSTTYIQLHVHVAIIEEQVK